ncbi:L-rhamnose mutarotase [Jatrophihabitans telluris]|uniref:L-rhamnose mutarotase n=1 Tax=Jatrophihabitans telluris TaxID=2038343 RepID=A0ABY4QVZ6_9ACTN|nr:L-rhamnose mutarotase [Jatrophihabitans telluris]UQX87437.1 L-rhamnose mutarotase [Jatrophihabitans telluris]
MNRICFTLRIRPESVAEYRNRHAAVWPEMRSSLSAAGWHNYSIFVGDDGTVVGYLETEDFELARQRMQGSEVNERWQREMAPFFLGLDEGAGTADAAMIPLPEAFHLA